MASSSSKRLSVVFALVVGAGLALTLVPSLVHPVHASDDSPRPCPPGMAFSAGICMDRYEARLLERGEDGSLSPFRRSRGRRPEAAYSWPNRARAFARRATLVSSKPRARARTRASACARSASGIARVVASATRSTHMVPSTCEGAATSANRTSCRCYTAPIPTLGVTKRPSTIPSSIGGRASWPKLASIRMRDQRWYFSISSGTFTSGSPIAWTRRSPRNCHSSLASARALAAISARVCSWAAFSALRMSMARAVNSSPWLMSRAITTTRRGGGGGGGGGFAAARILSSARLSAARPNFRSTGWAICAYADKIPRSVSPRNRSP